LSCAARISFWVTLKTENTLPGVTFISAFRLELEAAATATV